MARSAPNMFGFGAFYAVCSFLSARFPRRANFIASAAVIISVCAIDSTNYAGAGIGEGAIIEAILALVVYGSMPFAFGTVILPQIEALAVALLAFAVRRRVRGGGVVGVTQCACARAPRSARAFCSRRPQPRGCAPCARSR